MPFRLHCFPSCDILPISYKNTAGNPSSFSALSKKRRGFSFAGHLLFICSSFILVDGTAINGRRLTSLHSLRYFGRKEVMLMDAYQILMVVFTVIGLLIAVKNK